MQLLVYLLVYPFVYLISILPFRLLYAFSDLIYLFVYRIFGYRTNTVRKNLKLVFPEKSEEEIKDITKKFYHHLCDMIVESMKSLTISEAQIKKRFTFTNVDEIKKVEALKKGIIVMCAHYSNFEWIFILQTYIDSKGYGIYKRLSNKYFDRLVKRIRAKYNSHLITTKEAIPVLTKAKKDGELTFNGFISDQSPKKNKAYHWNDFMGIKVPVHTGAEMLAKRLDMSVMFFTIKKLKRGYYETTFQTITNNPKEFKDYEITDIFLKLVEQQIYEAPEYYLWTHKRWKHRHDVPAKFQ